MAIRISELIDAGALTGSELLEVSRLSATVTRTATTISAAAADNSLNDSAAGFVAAGFAVGDSVRVQGFTGNVANNIFSGRITALTAGKLTIGGTDGDVLVDDAAGESVTITKWETRRANLRSGSVPIASQLDPYAAGLWSCAGIKLLRSTGTGNPLIRVRRDSDGAEMDVGHLSNGALDSAAMLLWAGSASVFVVRLYDQTGNGRHFEAPTTARQPRIVNAGVFDGFVRFDSTDDGMATNSAMPAGGSALSVAMRYSLRSPAPAADAQTIWKHSLLANAGHNAAGFQQQNDSGLYHGYIFTGASTIWDGQFGAYAATVRTELSAVDCALTVAAQFKVFRAGASVAAGGSNVTDITSTFTAETMWVGSNHIGSQLATMNLDWVALWTNSQAANGVAISSLV